MKSRQYSVTLDKSHNTDYDGILFSTMDSKSLPTSITVEGEIKNFSSDFGNTKERKRLRGLLDFLAPLSDGLTHTTVRVTPTGRLVLDKKDSEFDSGQMIRVVRDILTRRGAMNLTKKEAQVIKREAGETVRKSDHNNEQVRFQKMLKNHGIKAILEQNFLDVQFKDFIVELKLDSSKGEIEHAFGHLKFANRQNPGRKMVVLTLTPVKSSQLSWLTEEGISVIVRKGNHYTLQNKIPAHTLLKKFCK